MGKITMRATKLICFLIILVLLGGCSRSEKHALKEAGRSMKRGDYPGAMSGYDKAIKTNRFNPYSYLMRWRAQKKALSQVTTAFKKGDYATSLKGADVLSKLAPENQEIKDILSQSKGHILTEEARESIEKGELAMAIPKINEAQKLLPNDQEVKSLMDEVNSKSEDEGKRLLSKAEALKNEGKNAEALTIIQKVALLIPQNEPARQMLDELQGQVLQEKKSEALQMAETFFKEGRYEAAEAKAREVLAIDSQDSQANDILRRAMEERSKPKLFLTGILQIMQSSAAIIRMYGVDKPFVVPPGEVFGDFKVVSIDPENNQVVVEYNKTKSTEILSTKKTEEEWDKYFPQTRKLTKDEREKIERAQKKIETTRQRERMKQLEKMLKKQEKALTKGTKGTSGGGTGALGGKK